VLPSPYFSPSVCFQPCPAQLSPSSPKTPTSPCITAWPRWTEDIVSTFNENPATLQFGQGQLAPFLEACLLGLPEGTHQTFELSRPRLSASAAMTDPAYLARHAGRKLLHG
jgi:FKBP-type peptidyl-prolyl cis-trans isomerase SlpA